MKRIPSLKTAMTPFPQAISPDADISAARAMMQEHDVRHLPVWDPDGQLVGVIAAADLRAVPGVHPGATAPTGVRVGDLCRRSAMIVELNRRLVSVLEEMADKHVDCVVVTREDRLVGILTMTDAYRALAKLLREIEERPDGTEAA